MVRARPRVAPGRRAATVLALLAAFATAAACSSGHAMDAAEAAQERLVRTPEDEAPGNAPGADTTAHEEAGFDYRWTRLPLGAGGWVTGIVIHASGAMYARTDVGGAYRYDAATSTWQQLLAADTVPNADPARHEYAVESLAVSPADPNVVLVAVGGDENPAPGSPFATTGRVLRSSDGGRTWTASATPFFVNGNQALRQRAERLAFDPADPKHVLFGTRRQGLWESTDGGATFRQVPLSAVPAGEPNGPEQDHGGVAFATFDPATPGRAYVGVQGKGVYRSDDRGASWRQIASVANGKFGVFEGVVSQGRLYVAFTTIEGDAAGRLSVYDPSSGAFADITPGARSSGWSIAIDPTRPERMVAAGDAVADGTIFVSVDAGKKWQSLDISIESAQIPWLARTDLDKYMSIGRLVFDPKKPGRLWFGEGMGVWRTDDLAVDAPPSAITWHLDARGIEELVIADVVVPPGQSPISVAADRQGFRSTSLTDFPARTLVDQRFAGGTDLDYSGGNPKNLVWIGAEYHIYWQDNRVARAAISTDGGASWSELPNLKKEMFGGNVAVSATDPNNIVWLPSYYINPWEHRDLGKGLYVTSNAGRSWRNLTVDGKNNFHRLMWWLGRQALASDKVDGGVFYLQDDTQTFYVSTDGGNTWKKAAHAAPCLEANACHVFGQIVPSPVKAGEIWSSVGEGGLYRTRDRGATAWEKLPGVEVVHSFGFGAPLTKGGPQAVYVYGTANGDPRMGIWRSGDDGRSWQLLGRTPLGIFAGINAVRGDPDHPGRVFVGYSGLGVVYGDDPALR